jgi:O-antigen/teichoic acid export membrane protein
MSGASSAKKLPPVGPVLEIQSSSTDVPAFRQQMGQISRHSAVFFGGTIFTAATGYLFKIYLARVLGAEALGIYALGMTIVGFLGIFNALGLPSSAVRFVAGYVATARLDLLRGFLARSVFLLLIFNLLLGGLVLLLGPWVAIHVYHTSALSKYLGLFALIMVTGAMSAFLCQVLTGYKDVARRTVITNFIGSPLTMIFTVGLAGAGLGLWGYLSAQIASAVVVLALLAMAVWKLTPKAARSASGRLASIEKEVISFSALVFAMDAMSFLMSQADRILIGFYLDARAVGIYAMAAALVAFVPAILQAVNQIFAPTIADLYVRGQQQLLGRLYQTLTKWILGLTLPLGFFIMIFARELMHIFGREFEVGWPILIVGCLGQLVNCGVGSVGYLLLMSGQQRALIRIQVVMAGVMIGLGLLLIPAWGILGAAAAAAVTIALSNVWYLTEVRRKLGLFPYNYGYFRLLPPLLASAAALALLRLASSSFHPEWIVLGVALSTAYAVFILVALVFGLDPDDRVVVGAAWSRIRGMTGGG